MDQELVKAKIEREIEKTKELIEEYQELTKPEAPDVAVGRVSRMDAINNRSITEAALRQSEQKLKALNQVYAKIDHEDFGTCLKCNNPIPLGRILIRPESLYCVRCAQ